MEFIILVIAIAMVTGILLAVNGFIDADEKQFTIGMIIVVSTCIMLAISVYHYAHQDKFEYALPPAQSKEANK